MTYAGWPEREKLSEKAKMVLDMIGDHGYFLFCDRAGNFCLEFSSTRGLLLPPLEVKSATATELIGSGLIIKMEKETCNNRLGTFALALHGDGDYYACRQ
jgi:hypothetical protein